jgi:poly(3-hydroxybutyrate) depolymerase
MSMEKPTDVSRKLSLPFSFLTSVMMIALKKPTAWATLLMLGINVVVARPQATSGCGIAKDFAGTSQNFTIESGRKRQYRLHLPSSYNEDDKTPLLIAYHGNGGDKKAFEELTLYSDEDLNPDWITVFPAGVEVRAACFSPILR